MIMRCNLRHGRNDTVKEEEPARSAEEVEMDGVGGRGDGDTSSDGDDWV